MNIIQNLKKIGSNMFNNAKTNASNAIHTLQERQKLRKYVRNIPQLSSEQKKAVKEYWKPYCKVSTDWARYYTFITGRFDARYLPGDLPLRKVDQYYNQWKWYGFTDKNNYSLIFPGIKQPKTIIRKVGNLLFDEEYNLIDLKQAEGILNDYPEVVVKPSIDSFGGMVFCSVIRKLSCVNLKIFYRTKAKNISLFRMLSSSIMS